MKQVALTWKADGNIDSYTIYRVNDPFPEYPLPLPTAEGITTKSYIDELPLDLDSKYYYRIESIKGNERKISELLEVIITEEGEEEGEGYFCSSYYVDVSITRQYPPSTSAVMSYVIENKTGEVLSSGSVDGGSDGALEIGLDRLFQDTDVGNYIYMDSRVSNTEEELEITFENDTGQDLKFKFKLELDSMIIFDFNWNLCKYERQLPEPYWNLRYIDNGQVYSEYIESTSAIQDEFRNASHMGSATELIFNPFGLQPLQNIGYQCFRYWNKVTSLDLHEGLLIIESYAFGECTSLQELLLPNSVTTLGDQAFSVNTSLTKVTFGTGLTNLGPYVFSGSFNLKTLIFTGPLPTISSTGLEGITVDNIYVADVYFNDYLTYFTEKGIGHKVKLLSTYTG